MVNSNRLLLASSGENRKRSFFSTKEREEARKQRSSLLAVSVRAQLMIEVSSYVSLPPLALREPVLSLR